MAKWAIVQTYYKHAEYSLVVKHNDEDLRTFILNTLEEYASRDDDHNYNDYPDYSEHDLEDLIEIVVRLGNERVCDFQRGWGVREIRDMTAGSDDYLPCGHT